MAMEVPTTNLNAKTTETRRKAHGPRQEFPEMDGFFAERAKAFEAAVCGNEGPDEDQEPESVEKFLQKKAQLMNNSIGSINLFTREPQSMIMPVTNGPLVWIQVPVAVDSGCCRHVTPNGVFCLVPTPTAGAEGKQNFYGAGGDAIA